MNTSDNLDARSALNSTAHSSKALPANSGLQNPIVSPYRADFPAMSRRIQNKKWHYMDSAATALKPWPVIERLSQFYSYEVANVHRGAFHLADLGTQAFEKTREKARAFLNAASDREIVFTKGTTEGYNLLAAGLGEKLKPGDEILLSEVEHHANIVPWQIAAGRAQAVIKVIPVRADGDLDLVAAAALINVRTRVVSVTHCSNVTGIVNDVKKIAALAHAVGATMVVDGAQAAANFPVDVRDLDCDFYVFSGHKVFGPFGVGILYGKEKMLETLSPYQSGGSMISEVRFEKTTYNDLPFRFEAGTPAIAEVIALAPALDYLTEKVGREKAQTFEHQLYLELIEKVRQIPEVKIFGRVDGLHAPLLSLALGEHHSSDVAQILDQENVAIRAGHLCAQPLMRKWSPKGFVRVSLSLYNDSTDIDALIAGLNKAKELLQ